MVTSFGFYGGLLNCKNTSEVGKEFDFFCVLLNSFAVDDVRTKTEKMCANSDMAPFPQDFSLHGESTRLLPTVDSLRQQTVQHSAAKVHRALAEELKYVHLITE